MGVRRGAGARLRLPEPQCPEPHASCLRSLGTMDRAVGVSSDPISSVLGQAEISEGTTAPTEAPVLFTKWGEFGRTQKLIRDVAKSAHLSTQPISDPFILYNHYCVERRPPHFPELFVCLWFSLHLPSPFFHGIVARHSRPTWYRRQTPNKATRSLAASRRYTSSEARSLEMKCVQYDLYPLVRLHWRGSATWCTIVPESAPSATISNRRK